MPLFLIKSVDCIISPGLIHRRGDCSLILQRQPHPPHLPPPPPPKDPPLTAAQGFLFCFSPLLPLSAQLQHGHFIPHAD